jgi:hypothetical protein
MPLGPTASQPSTSPRVPPKPVLLVLDLDGTLLRDPLSTHGQAEGYARRGALRLGDPALDDLFFDAELLHQLSRHCAQVGHVVRIATHATITRRDFACTLVPPPVPAQVAGLFEAVLGGGDLTRPEHIVAAHTADKCRHIEDIREQVSRDCSLTFPADRIVLIDDEFANVQAARDCGYRAYHCPQGLTRTWLKGNRELRALLLGRK